MARLRHKSPFAGLECVLRAEPESSRGQHHASEAETPAAGFLTSEAWAHEWRCSLSHAMYKIKRQLQARPPTMERRVYRTQQAVRLYPTPHYRLIAATPRRRRRTQPPRGGYAPASESSD